MTLMCKEMTLISGIGRRVGSEARCTLRMDFVYDCVFRMRLTCAYSNSLAVCIMISDVSSVICDEVDGF